MNPLPPNADELVSAYLDGEAAPDEIALVESSPELLEQVESLRSLTAPLAEPLVPPAAKEAHLSAALGAFDELFASETGAAAPEQSDQPRLAAVPRPEPVAAAATPAADSTSTVTSFEAARERRRRRVSPAVIAAAIAAVALLLFAVLSTGPRSDDTATTSLDAAVEIEAEAASDDASEAVTADDAMDDDEEAMEEEASVGGMSDAAEAPQASAAPAEDRSDAGDAMADSEAMDNEEAMEEVAMADEEDAMDDEEAMDEDESSGADTATDPRFDANIQLYAFGDISELPLLQEQLDAVDIAELRIVTESGFEGLFPRCRGQLDELPNDQNSLLGEGVVDSVPVEVHLVEQQDERRIYVIAAGECRVVFDFALST